MKLVSQILKGREGQLWAVSPAATVLEALRLMAEKNVGALLVLDEDRLVGIFSERDYARKVILKGKASRDTAVSEIMSERVVCVSPEQTVEDCMAVMTDKRVRHLPVLSEGRIIGVISIGDAVKAVISDQRFEIEQLEKYITG